MHKHSRSCTASIKTVQFFSLLTTLFFITITSIGCNNSNKLNENERGKNDRIVIWTDNSEFAQIIELFNETHSEKAILVYKENPAASLPPQLDELQPDIIIAPWLRNEKTKRYFMNLDFLFDRKFISSPVFYPMLLKAGVFSNKQYLLPVNFNLPAIIFSKENKDFIEDDYMLSLEQLKRAGEAFNKKNKKGSFIKMGFAPESSNAFLYQVAKIQGSDFKESKTNTFTWNSTALQDSISFLKSWITEVNGSTQIENDFVYKYLSVTDDKRVTQGKTLFAYTTSDKLFELTNKSRAEIDFRWLQNDGFIPVEDSLSMLGIAKHSKNQKGAVEFISWLFKTESQQKILERKNKMNLDTMKFGIANGFSTIKEVNEYILPIYYKTLLSNTPQAGSFKVFDKKPATWEKIKEKIIIPYIKDSITSTSDKKISTMEERYSEWKKQGFN